MSCLGWLGVEFFFVDIKINDKKNWQKMAFSFVTIATKHHRNISRWSSRKESFIVV